VVTSPGEIPRQSGPKSGPHVSQLAETPQNRRGLGSGRVRHYLAWLETVGLTAPRANIESVERYFAHLSQVTSYGTTKAYVADVLRLHRLAFEADPTIFSDLPSWSWPQEIVDEHGAGEPGESRVTRVSVEELERHFQHVCMMALTVFRTLCPAVLTRDDWRWRK
jgi:hypothetical protein